MQTLVLNTKKSIKTRTSIFIDKSRFGGIFLFYCSFFDIFLYLCVIERVYYEKVVGYFGALPCGNGLL